jgi:hypothetical protein
MKRFYYSAFRDTEECDGIIRAESIDTAREKLIHQGYEEITLEILTSSDDNLDSSPDETKT